MLQTDITSKATTYMHGGDHYLKLGIQPLEFAMANKLDACAFSILKYLSRHLNKNGVEDLKKARHFVELREQFAEHATSTANVISMDWYIARNGISGATKHALIALEWWLVSAPDSRDSLLHWIDVCIAEYEKPAAPLLP